MRVRAALAIAVAIVAGVHAIHYLCTGLPFSTDVWPLIRDSEKLLANPSAKIWNDTYFDGYNNHWPGAILGASIESLVTGLGLRLVYGLYLALALSVALALLVYVYASRKGSRVPWVNALVLAAVPSWIVFTSSTLKEVYCYPIAMLILILPALSRGRRAAYALLPLLALASSLTHHLATAMCIGIAAGAVILSLADYVYGDERALATARDYGIALAIALPIFVAYYLAYGGKPLKISVGLGDIEALALYALAIYGAIFLAAIRTLSTKLKIAVLSASAAAMALCVELELVPGIYVPKSLTLALYAAPLLLVVPLAREIPIVPRSIATTLAVAVPYVSLANPALASALHRLLNYATLALSTSTYSARTLARRVLLYTILALCVSSAIATQLLIDEGRDPVSFYWLYTHEDTALASYIAKHASTSITILGGAKLEYITGIAKPPLIALADRRLAGSEALAISVEDERFGIPIALNLYRAPPTSSLLRSCSLIYSSRSWILALGGCRWS